MPLCPANQATSIAPAAFHSVWNSFAPRALLPAAAVRVSGLAQRYVPHFFASHASGGGASHTIHTNHPRRFSVPFGAPEANI